MGCINSNTIISNHSFFDSDNTDIMGIIMGYSCETVKEINNFKLVNTKFYKGILEAYEHKNGVNMLGTAVIYEQNNRKIVLPFKGEPHHLIHLLGMAPKIHTVTIYNKYNKIDTSIAQYNKMNNYYMVSQLYKEIKKRKGINYKLCV